MNDLDTKLYVAIAGVFIGLCGFFYGLWKDLKLRKIERRAQAPHFVVKDILLDIIAEMKPEGKPRYYQYNEQPGELGRILHEKQYGEAIIPEDYPDNLPAGLRLINEGPSIRYFKINPPFYLLKKVQWGKNIYDLYYQFYWKDFGKKSKFKIWYEIETGSQGTQQWEFVVGKNELRRIKPK